MHIYFEKDFSIETSCLKKVISNNSYDVLNIAAEIYLIYDLEIYKECGFQDIYDFCKYKLDLSRRRVNEYLDVCHVYLDYVLETESPQQKIYAFVLKDDFFEYMNFSQLRACLNLSSDECRNLGIQFFTSVHEIEAIKKEYFKRNNKKIGSEISEQEIEKGEVQNTTEDKTFDSLSDLKRGINIFQDDFIPEDSEYEFIFRNQDTLIKGRKRKSNVNTAIKMLRTIIENNSEEEFYYAVVKIKKPL